MEANILAWLIPVLLATLLCIPQTIHSRLSKWSCRSLSLAFWGVQGIILESDADARA